MKDFIIPILILALGIVLAGIAGPLLSLGPNIGGFSGLASTIVGLSMIGYGYYKYLRTKEYMEYKKCLQKCPY